MSGPITWRTVTGPSLAEAAKPMAMASLSINNAFDQARGLLDGYQKQTQAIEDRQEQGRLLAAKELLQGATTPEQVEALREQLAIARAGMSNDSRAALLGAEEARTASLQRSTLADRKFKREQQVLDQEHQVQAIKAMQPKDGLNALSTPEYSGLLNVGDLAQGLRAALAAGEKQQVDLAHTRQQTEASKGDLRVKERNADTHAAQVRAQQQANDITRGNALIKAGAEAASQAMEKGSGLIGNEAGRNKLLEYIRDNVPEKEGQATLLRQVAALAADPKYQNVPVSVVGDLAIASKKPGGWASFWGAERGEGLRDVLDQYVSSDAFKATAASGALQRSIAAERALLLRSQGERLLGIPATASQATTPPPVATPIAPTETSKPLEVTTPVKQDTPKPAATEPPPAREESRPSEDLQGRLDRELREVGEGKRISFSPEVKVFYQIIQKAKEDADAKAHKKRSTEDAKKELGRFSRTYGGGYGGGLTLK